VHQCETEIPFPARTCTESNGCPMWCSAICGITRSAPPAGVQAARKGPGAKSRKRSFRTGTAIGCFEPKSTGCCTMRESPECHSKQSFEGGLLCPSRDRWYRFYLYISVLTVFVCSVCSGYSYLLPKISIIASCRRP